MPHSVTVTRTTTTTNRTSSAIIVNTGYLKTVPGLLKLFHVILNLIVVIIICWYYNHHGYGYWQKFPYHEAEVFAFLMSTTFFVGSLILFLCCLLSLATATILPKTSYEYVYHSFGFVLLLLAGLIFVYEVTNKSRRTWDPAYEAYVSAAVILLVNSVLYLAASILAYRHYKRG